MENNHQLAIFFETIQFAVIFFILPVGIFLAVQFLTSYKIKNRLLRILPTVVAEFLFAVCCFGYLYGIYTMSAETRYFASLLVMLASFCIAGCVIGHLAAVTVKKRKSM